MKFIIKATWNLWIKAMKFIIKATWNLWIKAMKFMKKPHKTYYKKSHMKFNKQMTQI